MSTAITVAMQQISPTTTKGVIRDHEILVDRPVAKEGTDQGPMGGELLLAALGGCFMSTLLAAIRGRDAAVSNVTANVVGTLDGTPARFTAIELQLSADYDDADQMHKLVTIAERACIVANSIKDGLELTVRVV